mgnify:FL=1
MSQGYGQNSGRRLYSYDDTTSTIAEATASGFFNTSSPELRPDDLVFITASDDRELVYVASVGPVTVVDLVTSSSVVIPDGSVTNAKLADGAVSGAKVADLGIDAGKYAAASIATADVADSAITGAKISNGAIGSAKVSNGSLQLVDMATEITDLLPLHAVQVTSTGGNATEAFSLSGVTADDVCVATLHTAGATPVTINSAACEVGAVSIVFSADPSTDHVINIIVHKPTN